MRWLHLAALALIAAFAKAQEKDLLLPANIATSDNSEENTKLLLPSPKVAADSSETNTSPARQRPQQGPGWGGLISGKKEKKFKTQKYTSIRMIY